MKKNKKANMDFLYAGLFMFLLIIMTIIGSYVWSAFSSAWTSSEATTAGSKQLVSNIGNNWYKTFDAGVVLCFFLLWVVTVILSFYLDNSPIFFIAFIIFTSIFIICLAMLGTFLTALQETPLASTLAQLPMTSWIIDKWVLMLVFFAVSVGASLYAKNAVRV